VSVRDNIVLKQKYSMLLIVEVIMTELSVRTLLTSESHVEAAATTCYT